MNGPRTCISLMLLGVLVAACNTPTPGSTHTYYSSCSPPALIGAINQANADPGPAIIDLAAGCEYIFTSAYNTQTISGIVIPSALPPITSEITIVGNHALLNTSIRIGFEDPHFGFFLVSSEGSLRMNELTMKNGWRALGGAVYINRGTVYADSVMFFANVAEGQQPGASGKGGAVYNREGGLTVIGDSRVVSNSARDVIPHQEGIDSIGGGIYNDNGFLMIVNGTLSSNTADKGGAVGLRRSAGSEGREGVVISGDEFFGNDADAEGGAIYSEGERTPFYIADSDFTQNIAGNRGGAIQIRDSILDMGYSNFLKNVSDDCGAVESTSSSDLTVSNTVFNDNTANGSGGGLCHDGNSLNIRGSQFLSNQSALHGGGVFATRPFTVRNSTFDSNQAGELGGGIFAGDSADIDGSTFSGNKAFKGGGLYGGWLPGITAGPAISVGIRRSTFHANLSETSAGHVNSVGGGIAFAGEQLEIDQSAIWLNQSPLGGGVYASAGKVSVVNSTISMNLSGNGAGLYLTHIVEASFLNASIVDNQANSGSAALAVSGPTTIKNTIVTGVGGALACLISDPGPFNPQGENLDNDGSCTGFTLTRSNYGVYAVADNGGPTYTNALAPSSPAVDAAADCGGLTVDQRGQPRPYGARCDLGAFELGANNPNPPPPPLPDNPLPAVTETPPASQGLCEYRAIQNANCRAGDDARTSLVAVLTQGEVVKLLSLNPELTHGLFEIPDGRSCWVWLPLMEGPPDPRQSCNVTIVDPPEYVPETPACSADLPKDQCEAAGGTMSDGVTSAPHCICPQQESAASPSSGPRFASCAAARERSGDPSAGPEGLGSRFSVLWPVVF
jgi:predicted outer membrane repeat protein